MKMQMDLTTQTKGVPKEILTHPFVESLLERITFLSDQVERLEAEVRLLKSHSPKPKIPPSSNLEIGKAQPTDGIKKNSLH